MMIPYKSILVALDLSKSATQILTKAAAIAKSNEADIHVIYVMETPALAYSPWSNYPPEMDSPELKEKIYEELATLVENCGINRNKITLDTGRAIDQIVAMADQNQTDLIVIGSHGRHGIQLMLGSTANGVLHHAKCDVLAVRVTD